MNNFFKLHESFVFVKGYVRSALYDLVREDYFLISNEMGDFLNKYDGKEINELSEKNRHYLQNALDEKWGILIGKEEIDFFPPINFEWKRPYLINNATILFNGNIDFFKNCIDVLSGKEVLCKYVAVIVNELMSADSLESIKLILKSAGTIYFDLYFRYFEDYSSINFDCLQIVNKKKLVFFNAGREESNEFETYTERAVEVGFVDYHYFKPNIFSLSEAMSHNLYYNDKIIIDEQGFVINSLISRKRIDKFNKEKLGSILSELSQINFWNISKDKIDVCKNCEFRYMCNDDGQILKRENDTYFRATECAYNPYIAKWSFEEGYLSLIECGVKCDLTGYERDEELAKQRFEIAYST